MIHWTKPRMHEDAPLWHFELEDTMKVYQFVESLAVGDAVANDAVALDGLFRSLGICGGIYAHNKNNISERYLNRIAFPTSRLPAISEEDLILVHYAIYNEFCDSLGEIAGHKVLIYHNITPPRYFFRYSMGLYDATRKGLKQIKEIREVFDLCIADSEFNKQNLIDMGYTCPIHVCPVVIPFEDYTRKPNEAIVEKYSKDGYKNIICIGRVVPHKKIEDVIHAFALYKKNYNDKSRLFIVGGDDMVDYHNLLISYIDRLGLEDVYITGSVPFADILAYYSVADVYITMSEHEGLCVPVIEASYFRIPVIAYSCTALPYTLANCGVKIKEKDYLQFAAWIDRLICDDEVRNYVIENQTKQLKAFEYNTVVSNILDILKPVLPLDVLQPFDIDLLYAETGELNDFPLVMPIKDTDWNIARKSLPYIIRNIKPKKIVFISSVKLEPLLPISKYVQFIDENTLLRDMSFQKIADTIEKAGGKRRTAGWYLQQFLKLGYAFVCDDEYYLVWDADTLPVRPLTFFDSKSKKPLLNLKKEYVPDYFSTLDVLLEMEKCREESFITEHMIFNTKLCIEMIKEIEKQSMLRGKSFWERCIWAADTRENDYAFSEYETYGTYVMTRYPGFYDTRKLCTMRGGADFLGENPSVEMLNWAATTFDTISFEHWGCTIPWIAEMAKENSVREKYSIDEFIIKVLLRIRRKALFSRKAKEQYSTLKTHLAFDYYFDSIV